MLTQESIAVNEILFWLLISKLEATNPSKYFTTHSKQ